MKAKVFRIFIISYLFPFSCFAALKKWDFQIWNYDSVNGALSPLVDLYADIEFRFRDNARTFYYNHEHIEFMIKAQPFLIISPCYRQIWTRNQQNKWVGSSDPNLNLTLHGKWHGFQLYQRSRVTYHIPYDSEPNIWQYRNKSGLFKTFWRKPTEIALFVEDEFFLRQKTHGIYENRVSVGTNIHLLRALALEAGYRFRILKTGIFWQHDNVLLLSLRGFF